MARALLFQIHWLLGITAGAVLAVVGVTGAVLSFEPQILRALNPGVMTVDSRGEQPLPPAELIARIHAEVDGVVAVKECSGDTRRIPALLHLEGDLEVIVGGDDWALEGLAAGAVGWITGVGVLAPAECVELSDAIAAGELARARDVYRRLLPVARFDMTSKLVQYFKAGQDAVGFHGGPTRAPRLPLKADEVAALEDALAILREPAVA
jgi:4-hydroxy-tetrahydrodipicolinate synthase